MPALLLVLSSSSTEARPRSELGLPPVSRPDKCILWIWSGVTSALMLDFIEHCREPNDNFRFFRVKVLRLAKIVGQVVELAGPFGGRATYAG